MVAEFMAVYYFAYGSNLCVERMRGRIGSAQVYGRGWVAGYRVCFDKCGNDGTAKANLTPVAGARTWGVVYQMDAAALPKLDLIEGGYWRQEFLVHCGGRRLACVSYRSEWVDLRQRPAAWYVACVLEGARAQRLPSEHRRALKQAVADAYRRCPVG